MEAHELHSRLLRYYLTCVASGLRPSPGPDNKTFSQIVFATTPDPIEDVAGHYRAGGSHLPKQTGAYCEMRGRCDASTCTLVGLPAGKPFWSSLTRAWVHAGATGHAYLCCESNKIHCCERDTCPWIELDPNGEFWMCPASQRVYEERVIDVSSKVSDETFHHLLKMGPDPQHQHRSRADYDLEYAKRKQGIIRSMDKRRRQFEGCYTLQSGQKRVCVHVRAFYQNKPKPKQKH